MSKEQIRRWPPIIVSTLVVLVFITVAVHTIFVENAPTAAAEDERPQISEPELAITPTVAGMADIGSIYIQNQGGGLRSCQQIKVESEDELSSDTALNVFTVTLDSTVLDAIKAINPDVYEAMANGITYTYNISLLKNGDETQPNGKVTVYIPIPENLKALAYAGELAGEITGKVKVYRVEEDGNLTEMDVEIEDGCFVFTTDHFSLYTIVGYDLGENTRKNQDGGHFPLIAAVGLSVAIIVGVAAIVVVKRKKK